MKKLLALLVVLPLLLGGCSKKTEESLTPQFIDPLQKDAQTYLEMFAQEATLRGKPLNIKNVRFTFNDLAKTKGFWGYCHAETANNGFVVDLGKPTFIELDSTVWKVLNAVEKEWLMYHECGHCLLGRIHLNQTFDTGESASLMSQGDAGQYGGNVSYYSFKKDYYLRELFNSDGRYQTNTPVPDWATLPAYGSAKKKEIFRETFDNNRNNWPGSPDAIQNGQYTLTGGLWTAINAPFTVSPTADFEVEFDLKTSPNSRYAHFALGSGQIERPNVTGQNSLLTYLDFEKKLLGYRLSETPNLRTYSQLTNQIKPGQFNKITIRKIGDKVYYYINEWPAYVVNAPAFTATAPLWFYNYDKINYVDNVTCSVLN